MRNGRPDASLRPRRMAGEIGDAMAQTLLQVVPLALAAA